MVARFSGLATRSFCADPTQRVTQTRWRSSAWLLKGTYLQGHLTSEGWGYDVLQFAQVHYTQPVYSGYISHPVLLNQNYTLRSKRRQSCLGVQYSFIKGIVFAEHHVLSISCRRALL